jgi:outer membrane protein TolC
VKTALKGNRDIQNASIGVGRQQNTVDATASARYPQVSVGAKQSHVMNPQDFMIKAGALGSYPDIGPIPSEDRSISQVSGATTMVSVELLQPITTLYKVNMAVGAQKSLLGIARETERSQKQAVVQNVKQAYFEMLNVQNSLDAVKDSLKFLTDMKRVIKDQLTQGSTMKAELLQVDSQLADSRYQESALLNQMLTLKQNFNILLGRTISTPFRVALPENFQGDQEVGGDLPALESAAEKQRPEIIQSRLRISQAEYQREVTRFEWYPDIGLYASYLNQSNTGLLPGSLGFVGIKGQWSAVDWGKRNNEVAGQAKAVDQANKQADQIHDQVMAEVSAAWRNLLLLKSRQESTRAAMTSAEENFRVTYNRFKQKMALTKDVLQSQAQLSSARQQYQKSLLDFASARAELDRVTGRNP